MNNARDPYPPGELLMIRMGHRERRPGATCPVELIDVVTGTRHAFPDLQAMVEYVQARHSGEPSLPEA